MAESGVLAVIGCGNLNRRDDGVGVIAARRVMQWLASDPHDHVRVFDAGTGGMEVMFHARGAAALILIDACVSGSAPGTLFKLPGSEVSNRPAPSYSLHDFRWDHALYAGQRIFGPAFPSDVTVYLLEAADVSLGCDLSPVVAQSLERAVACIQDDIRGRSGGALASDFSSDDSASHGQRGCEARITIRDGSIYIDAGVYAKYLAGLESIVLLRRNETLLLLPVRHAAAGGLLLKIRNLQGDRVVHAQEFLRGQGLDERREWTLPVQWDSQDAALVAEWPVVSS